MSLVRFFKVKKSFAGNDILTSASFEIGPGRKIALVGPNGGGKSTILKLIAGQLQPDGGSVTVARSARPWLVAQAPDVVSARSALEECLAAHPELPELRRKLGGMEERLDAGGWNDGPLAAAYAEAVAAYSDAGGYQYEKDAGEALLELGLPREQHNQPFSLLSGGEQARVTLAKALLAAPSLLLLDEPDNHLDLAGIRWLEKTLLKFRGTLVVATHDRELLDRVVGSIIEVEDGHVTAVSGNYSAYLERKRDRIERQKREFLEQQRRVNRLREAIGRAAGQARKIENRTIHFHYRKRALKVARRAVTLKRRLERELRGEKAVAKPRETGDGIRVELPAGGARGGIMLEMRGVAKTFDGKLLFQDLHLQLSAGERLAVVGPNGCGKTTLLKIALGLEPPDEGEVWSCPWRHVFHCDQHHGGLSPERTIREQFEQEAGMDLNHIHYLLAKLSFRREAIHTRIGNLSGGEQTRLVLALLMNTPASLLVLDEPTNHLDLPSIEVLQEALAAFPGAVLFASHDRRLIQAVATATLDLGDLSAKTGKCGWEQ